MKRTGHFISVRTAILGGTLAALILFWGLFHAQIHRHLAISLLLDSNRPREESFLEVIDAEKDPVGVLNRCWATGKVTHRAFVAAFLKSHAATNPPWFVRAEPLVLAGCADADQSVREFCLGALELQKNPALFDHAAAQLSDPDPMLRLLGLEYLRKMDPKRAVPIVIRLLDDPDPRVVAGAELALMRWSGEDYGVRALLAVPLSTNDGPAQIDPANLATIRRGVEKRKEWWRLHAGEFATGPQPPSHQVPDADRALAKDFGLKDLDGKEFHLTDLRGKLVFLNFWATWCPACLTELPSLMALQTKHHGDVSVIGIALDGVPDEEGEEVEPPANTSEKQQHGLEGIHEKVARVVKTRGINYRVLLDPHGTVGGQYNGGELPTTVILDKTGRVRRRFIGERSPAVLEAMIVDAAR